METLKEKAPRKVVGGDVLVGPVDAEDLLVYQTVVSERMLAAAVEPAVAAEAVAGKVEEREPAVVVVVRPHQKDWHYSRAE